MKKVITLAFVNLIPFVVLIFQIFEMVDVVIGNQDYPFESEFLTMYSIYNTKTIFFIYKTFFCASLVTMIITSIIKKRIFYYILLAFNIILFLYPVLTID